MGHFICVSFFFSIINITKVICALYRKLEHTDLKKSYMITKADILVESFLALNMFIYFAHLYPELGHLGSKVGIILTLILRCGWLLLHLLKEDITHFCSVLQLLLGVPRGVCPVVTNKSYLKGTATAL